MKRKTRIERVYNEDTGWFDVVKAQNKLQAMRSESLDWLKNALKEE